MALDRQKILTELGSVISQLKNADCGCMGKLFENKRQMPVAPGHHYDAFGSHRPNCSECSHNMASNAHKNIHFPCMGGCNAPKLYSDTYNYLSENMMKPTVQEVYDDLKSITPANTIMNNPAAMNQMGFNGRWEGGHSVDAQDAGAHPLKVSNYHEQNAVPSNNRQINHFGGMGPQIVNMLQGNNANTAHQDGQIAKPLMFDAPQFAQNENNVTSPSPHFMKHHNMDQSNPTSQFINQPNLTANGPQQNVTNTQPPNPMITNQHSYGQHAQGIAKFNEMFPGLVKNDLGFDPMSIAIQMNPANQKQAAIQSIHDMMYNKNTYRQDNNANVNNLQQSQVNSNMPFKQTYSENPPVSNEAHFVNQPLSNNMPGNQQMSMPHSNINNLGRDQTSYQVYPGLNSSPATNQQQQPLSNNIPGNQQISIPHGNINNLGRDQTSCQVYPGLNYSPATNQQLQPLSNNIPGNQQMSIPHGNINNLGRDQTSYQVYPGLNNSPATNQQQKMQQRMQYQQQNVVNADNSTAVVKPPIQTLPTVNENNEIAYDQTVNNISNRGNFQHINEPIFPVDTTKKITSQNYGYNTLGQPVKMLPANSYHTPVPLLPQTLSPQPTNKFSHGYSKYSNVKSTVSKTSLLANRSIGKTASKNQMQQMYNQYKGSTSHTQQNLKDIARSRETNSDGRLHASQINPNINNQIPVEKIGGDSTMNNPIRDQAIHKTGQVVEQIGDAPSAKPINDTMSAQDPVINRKCRNGLQDMTFTSYPTSAAWSFHGCDRAPPSAKYRHRNRF